MINNDQVQDKIQQLIQLTCKSSKHKFRHINGDCNLTHFGNCMPFVKLDGLWLEFGVYQGKTIGTIADLQPNKPIYGFDSFYGLPEHWDNDNPIGSYTLHGRIPALIDRGDNVIHGERFKKWNDNIVLIQGLFESTLPEFVSSHKDMVAFIHIDSDLYSSAKTILHYLTNQIVPGTVICFDDWCGYPTCHNVDHEVKAFAEFLLLKQYNCTSISFQTYDTYSQVGFLIT